jgi:DNA topoisomerase-2
MSDSEMDSFDDGASSDFAPEKPAKATKAKPAAPKKAAAPKKTTAPTKARSRPAKDATAPKSKATKAAPKKKKKVDSDEDDENTDFDMDADLLDDDESILADTPPAAKKRPVTKKQKSSGNPLSDIANESFGLDGADEAITKAKNAAATSGESSRYQMVGLHRLVY